MSLGAECNCGTVVMFVFLIGIRWGFAAMVPLTGDGTRTGCCGNIPMVCVFIDCGWTSGLCIVGGVTILGWATGNCTGPLPCCCLFKFKLSYFLLPELTLMLRLISITCFSSSCGLIICLCGCCTATWFWTTGLDRGGVGTGCLCTGWPTVLAEYLWERSCFLGGVSPPCRMIFAGGCCIR